MCWRYGRSNGLFFLGKMPHAGACDKVTVILTQMLQPPSSFVILLKNVLKRNPLWFPLFDSSTKRFSGTHFVRFFFLRGLLPSKPSQAPQFFFFSVPSSPYDVAWPWQWRRWYAWISGCEKFERAAFGIRFRLEELPTRSLVAYALTGFIRQAKSDTRVNLKKKKEEENLVVLARFGNRQWQAGPTTLGLTLCDLLVYLRGGWASRGRTSSRLTSSVRLTVHRGLFVVGTNFLPPQRLMLMKISLQGQGYVMFSSRLTTLYT